MTNWTNLIDTDPVGAYHAFEDWKKDCLRRSKRKSFGINEEHLIRMTANLAVLCEELSIYHIRPGSRENEEAKAFRLRVMRRMFNSDGSRRFPEVT